MQCGRNHCPSFNAKSFTNIPHPQVGIGVSSLCAFELFKEFGMSGDHDASDDKFFNLAGLIIPIVGAFGRIGWGLLGDKVSYKILFIVGNVVSVILQV